MATKRTFIGNIKGPQGETGATGAQGPVGPGATIEVGTVSTTAYGNTAQVVNSGTETAAVLDFVIPQGKPGEQTTKMGALTLDTITAQSAEYPIPAVGDTGATAFGKIVKFFNDVKTAVNSKINISDIVNNLTSTATNKPLSAAQGKTLNDAIGTVNTNLARSYISNIGGNAVLEKSGNVCVLHYTIAYFDPNGTLVPEALRPKFGNGVWNEVVVTNDYTNNYAMQVTNGGKVQLQKNGVAVSTQLNGIRGQVSWII